MGQLSFNAFHQRLERSRRADPQPVRPRPQPVRLKLRLGRRRGGQPVRRAVGTETDGSIICPSQTNGIVGLKPTVGLVSRGGIIPIAHSQDTAGPMARTVGDAALLLATLAGPNPRDAGHAGHDDDRINVIIRELNAPFSADGLRGARIGVTRNAFGFNPRVDAIPGRGAGRPARSRRGTGGPGEPGAAHVAWRKRRWKSCSTSSKPTSTPIWVP